MEDLKFTITVGHDDRDGNAVPIARRVRALGYAERAMARLCGGVTRDSRRSGLWVNPDGETVYETVTSLSAVYTGVDSDKIASAIDGIARSIAEMLNQHSVMIERSRVMLTMVGPK